MSRKKKAWLNVSSKGISGSIKTPLGTYNTRKGLSPRRVGCPLTVLSFLFLFVLLVRVFI